MSHVASSSVDDDRLTIWQELDRWAAEFKLWQRYVVGHLVREGTLSAQRIDDAYALFLAEHELGTAPSPAIEIPTTLTGRPASAASSPIHITKICNLAFINALPASAELTFSADLTVVYGGNGVGKSGFARVFSNACFSRAQHKILPNIHVSTPQGPPSAEITVELTDQGSVSFNFDGQTEHSDLKRIAIFDADVARVHLAAQNVLGFKPVGFDVFPEMASCYGVLSRKLEEDVKARTRKNDFSTSFVLPESEISRLVSGLSHATDLDILRAHAEFGLTEAARIIEIDRQIGELQAKSVPEAIEQFGHARREFGVLSSCIANAISLLSDEVREVYKQQISDLFYKNRVVSEQGSQSFKTEMLKSIGGHEWETFVSFAKDVGKLESEDYPKPEDRCLLCQQPLDSSAHALIHRIWEFLDSESRTQAHDAADLVSKSAEIIEKLDLDFFASTTTCHDHMRRINPSLEARISQLIEQIRNDYYVIHAALCDAYSEGRVGKAIGGQSWEASEATAVQAALEAQMQQIDADVIRLRDQSPEEALQALSIEKYHLSHRQVLSQLLSAIEQFVTDAKWINAAETIAKPTLNTRPLTAKETEFFGRVVADGYRRKLKEECSELNCTLPIEFRTEGRKGQTLRSLSMTGGHSPDEILSEGEQRAIALADFLTEVGLNPANAGIILDDPVTSQDHLRKRRIAHRLVKESATRQVVIFTHDLLFLTMLATEASEQGREILTHWLERDSDGRPGQISLDDSPATTPQYRDTKKAKRTLAEAKNATGSARVKLIQRGMGELRRTVEEVVPHFLLKEVVKRWSDRIMVTALKNINFDQTLVSEIVSAYEELSAYIEGHTHTEETVGSPPEPVDLERYTVIVDALIKRAKSNRQSVQAE